MSNLADRIAGLMLAELERLDEDGEGYVAWRESRGLRDVTIDGKYDLIALAEAVLRGLWQPISEVPELGDSTSMDALVYSPRFGVQKGTVYRIAGEPFGRAPSFHGDWGVTYFMPLLTGPNG